MFRLPFLDVFAGGQITPAGQPGRTLQEGRLKQAKGLFLAPFPGCVQQAPLPSPWPSAWGWGTGAAGLCPGVGSLSCLHQPEALPGGCLSPCLPSAPAPSDRGPEVLTVALGLLTCLPCVLWPQPAELGTWASPCRRLRCQAAGAWLPRTPRCSWLGIASSGLAPPGTGRGRRAAPCSYPLASAGPPCGPLGTPAHSGLGSSCTEPSANSRQQLHSLGPTQGTNGARPCPPEGLSPTPHTPRLPIPPRPGAGRPPPPLGGVGKATVLRPTSHLSLPGPWSTVGGRCPWPEEEEDAGSCGGATQGGTVPSPATPTPGAQPTRWPRGLSPPQVFL